MGTLRWRGDAPAIAQVDTLTPANVGIGDTFTATINGKSITVTATAATVANVTGLMTTAWNASAIPEFAEITATDSTTHVTLTADTAGKPFTVTATEADGNASDTQTFTQATTTACSGPNFWNVAANWSTGAVPIAADDVWIDSGASILYGLSNSGATLASLNIMQSFTGEIGLPYINEDGTIEYTEYRTAYLTLEATVVNIGAGVGTGSGRIKLNLGSVQTTVNVFNSGNTAETGLGSIIIKGTHASNTLNVTKGDVDVAPFAGEAATLLTVNVGYLNNQTGDSDVYLGAGVTLTNATIKVSGGRLETNSATSGTATITVSGGTVVLNSGGQLGLAVRGGEVQYNTTGTLGGNPVVSNSGHLDFSRDLRSKAVTNPIEVYGTQARVSDPHKVVSSLVLDMNETAKLENMLIGTNIRLTRGTPA